MIFKSIPIIIITAIFTGIFSSDVIATERPEVSSNPDHLAKIQIADNGQFDVNRIRSDMENNGMFVSYRISGHSGMEWPKGEYTFINFASGIWLAGKVNGEVRTAVAEYGSEFVPGPYGSDPDDPAYRIYKLNYLNPYSEDYTEWPVEEGAPWIDANGDGVYNVEDGDKPDMLGDQMIWYVMNDGDDSSHTIFKTLPLNIEVQMTIWGYDRTSIVGDMMFVKSLIINKGTDTIDSTFIALWDDPDLGDAGDDFVGCDTILGLGFCYNDGADNDYGSDPPAIGYDFFQGPVVPSPGDTAFAFGRYIPNFKNLPMTSFLRLIKSAWNTATDPNDAEEAYYLLSGLDNRGLPIVNSETGATTSFSVPDDPNNNTGEGDGVWVDGDDYVSGDRRFLMSSGPFNMAPGDSQEVVFGIMIARGTDALNAVTVLKEVDVTAQTAFDFGFKTPKPEPISYIVATALENAIVLNWDDGINAVEQFTAAALFEIDSQGQKTWYRFQGYNVYQLETATGEGETKRLATYDFVDDITEIWDDVFDPYYGSVVNVRVQYGSDSGLKRNIIIDKDALKGDISLKVNRVYYYAVTAYAYNQNGEPKTIESEMNIIEVRPQISTTQIVSEEIQPGITSIPVIHISGSSDGSVKSLVIDPMVLTGHDYEVRFHYNTESSAILWDLIDISNNITVVSGNPIQNGINMESGEDVGVDANPIVEGLQIIVSGPPNEFKDFYATQNTGGPIDGNAGASADYNGYPGMGRENIENQQVNGSTWFITTSNGSNKNYEDFFPYVTRYAGGYGNPVGGMQYLIPDDYEFRFTATGSKMLNRGTELVIDTPLEIWNIGDVADHDDDFQLMGIFNDSDENGEWNLYQDDSPISGGTNDPYMEGFYVLEHTDRAPGTDGYDAMVAALTADPNASGDSIWATGPGLPLSVDGQITRVVLLNMTFVNWNGGDIEDASFPDNVDAVIPETGTIFRMVTTKPNNPRNVFFFSTDSLKPVALEYSPKLINVWPNPYFAYNPEERTPSERKVMFTHLPAKATIRIFDLAGNLIRIIQHSDGTQYALWDLTNMANRYISSGMYIIHIETDVGDTVLKLAVIQPRD